MANMDKHKNTILNTSDKKLDFVSGRNIVLTVQQIEDEKRTHDSPRTNSQTLADYKWDPKHTSGRIVSVRDNLLAYRLYNVTIGEAIRIMDRTTRSRHLIKEFRHPIVDIQWAVHTPLLAIVDKQANLYVYKVDEACKSVYYFNLF